MSGARPGTADVTRVGVLLPTREQAVTGTVAIGPLVRFAGAAEQLGFDSLWAGDSLTARPRLDPFTVLAAAGTATSRITLGTAALTPVLRHPLVGANLIASLDHVCDARLVLGLGSGFPIPESKAEFAALDVPFHQRVGRLDESVSLWRHAWQVGADGPSTPFAGRYWQVPSVDGLLRPLQPGGPPLWLASGDTDAVIERVARHYDGWLPFLPSAAAYSAAWQRIEARRKQLGRPAGTITPALYATVMPADDPRRAEEELNAYVAGYYHRSLDEVMGIQVYIWGHPRECAEKLADYVRAGARHLIIRIGSLDPEPYLATVAREIIPVLRRLPTG